MKRILFLSLLAFVILPGGIAANESVSDERISEISQRLESYNTDSLIERRDFLVSYQESDGEAGAVDSKGVPAGSASERSIEISIIEAMLVALGVVLLDNISEDSTTPPDTVFPVITILGDNPATVEAGTTYTDPGATATDDTDGSVTVSSSADGDTNTVGSYTITYTATDSAGNSSTATRTVNVVDTTAPVFTSAATFVVDENTTAIGTVTAEDSDGDTLPFSVSGSNISIDTSSGVLTFDSAPTYNSDGNNTYQATVQVSDGTASDSQDITVSVTEQSTSTNASDLFISEYAEGSSNNKYLEIFNGTGQEVSLDSYALPSVANAPDTNGTYEYWNDGDNNNKFNSRMDNIMDRNKNNGNGGDDLGVSLLDMNGVTEN